MIAVMPHQILVFSDLRCGLCRKMQKVLHALDWCKRLRFVNYHDPSARKNLAPDIPYADLDRFMHVKLPGGRMRTGFRAFRALTWYLPPLWLIAPILSLPGTLD